MKYHRLKTWPDAFQAVWADLKTFEVRRNDRGFEVEDFVTLLEYDPATGHTGRGVEAWITYIVDLAPFGCPGFVGMQIATRRKWSGRFKDTKTEEQIAAEGAWEREQMGSGYR